MPPTLGARRAGWGGRQLLVEELLVVDELVEEELSVDDPEEPVEPFAPAGLEVLGVSEEPDGARESVR